tara:strand:+ start:20813 stop:21700 length:888 start_codon:yes stop_codon:yes gene_type:complete
MKLLLASICFVLSATAFALPPQPTDPNHPGSATYDYGVSHEKLKIMGRDVDVFLPRAGAFERESFPVVVFGHGQAIKVDGYEMTFEHLAKRGIAVIHPMYDSGFFDRKWRRMAADYNQLVDAVLQRYEQLNPEQLIYAGHSKGAYIALMAAGAPNLKVVPKSLVLFAPAGMDDDYINKLDKNTAVSIIYGEADSIIGRDLIDRIYKLAPVERKQLLIVNSYSGLSADHYIPLNRSYIFGGRDGIGAFHYHGVWKWLMGAAWDVQEGARASNSFLYGEDALSSGDSNVRHEIFRSW